MILQSGVATTVNRGYYFYQSVMTTGSVAATVSINGLSPVSLADLSASASGVGYIALPECALTVTLTGDAAFALEPVALDVR